MAYILPLSESEFMHCVPVDLSEVAGKSFVDPAEIARLENTPSG
jgi:hypothetical protein